MVVAMTMDDEECFERGGIPTYHQQHIGYRKKLRKENKLQEVGEAVGQVQQLDDKLDKALFLPIEYLSFQNARRRMNILGCITAVNDMEIIVSLPNSMQGYVYASSVKSLYNDFLKAANENAKEQNFPYLSDLFKTGQSVVCSVLYKQIHRREKEIVLTLDPYIVNSGYKLSDLRAGMMITGCVIAIGDQIEIDVGISNVNAYLYLSRQETAKVEKGDIKLYQILRFAVREVVSDANKSYKVLILTTNMWLSTELKTSSLPLDCIYPGTLVEFEPMAEVQGGFNGEACGRLACLSRLHIPQDHSLVLGSNTTHINAQGLPVIKPRPLKQFKTNSYKACVLFVSPSGKVVVTLNWQDLLHAQITSKDWSGEKRMKIASVVESISGTGFVCRLDDGMLGLAPYNVKSDFKFLRTRLWVNLTNRLTVDGTAVLRSSSLEYAFMLESNGLYCGAMVHALVLKFTTAGVKVAVGDWKDACFKPFDLIGFIPLAEVELADPEKLFKPGDVIRARILHVNEFSALILTIKKNLIETTLPIVSSRYQLVPNLEAHVRVKKVLPNRIVVEFYNYLEGLIYNMPDAVVKQGEVLVARVLSVAVKGFAIMEFTEATLKYLSERNVNQLEDERSLNSIREYILVDQMSGGPIDPATRKDNLGCGKVVAAKLVGIARSGLTVVVGQQQDSVFTSFHVFGFISRFHLSDEAISDPLEVFHLGDLLRCRVLRYDATLDIHDLLLTNKQSLVNSQLPILSDCNQLKKDLVVHAYVTAITKSQCFVGLYNNITGSIPLRDISDDLRVQLLVGQVVVVTVKEYSTETNNLVLSLFAIKETKQTQKSLPSLLRKIEPLNLSPEATVVAKKKERFRIGQLVNLKVVSKAADRLTVQLDGTVHFLPLPLHHLSDFKTIAEAKYSLAKPNCVFRGLVVRPRENLVTLKENMLQFEVQEFVNFLVGKDFPGFISTSLSESVYIVIQGKTTCFCVRKFFSSCDELPEAPHYFTPGQSVVAKLKKKTPRSGFEFTLRSRKIYDKDRILKYFDSYRGLKPLFPKDFSVGIGDVVNVENVLNSTGDCAVEGCKASGYRGRFVDATDSKPGPAVVVFVDHSTKELILTNKRIIAESIQLGKNIQIRKGAEFDCGVLYVNQDVTVAHVLNGEEYVGLLACFATFPSYNVMFEVEKCLYDVGSKVRVKAITDDYDGIILCSEHPPRANHEICFKNDLTKMIRMKYRKRKHTPKVEPKMKKKYKGKRNFMPKTAPKKKDKGKQKRS